VTVVDTGPFPEAAAAAEQRRSSNPSSPDPSMTAARPRTGALHVEPMVGLEWSQAVEQWGGDDATSPAGARRSWLHRAPEQQVMALYQTIRRSDPDAPAPWWLRALAAGNLDTRAEGFAVEDRVTKLLSARTGWVFVPWGADGDSGYWEFVPSERNLVEPGMPTTLMFTDRHPGWLDVIRVHAGPTPDPVAVRGFADLRANLARLESMLPA
jgi:hypothetical protein